jgi:calmodulin
MEDYIPDYLLNNYQDAFVRFDKNKDGYLDIKEIQNASKSLGRELSDKDLDILFDAKSKLVDFNTFAHTIYKKSNSADLEDDVINAFRVFDKNDKGTISVSELKNIMTTIGDKLTEDEINLMIREADINNDGNINYEEFVRSMMGR